jgi:hypothetical protein
MEKYDKILQNIIFSPFKPGRWVKSITFECIRATWKYQQQKHSFDGDLLCLFMISCPDVIHVKLRSAYTVHALRALDWNNFLTALNIWNLNHLSFNVSSCTENT